MVSRGCVQINKQMCRAACQTRQQTVLSGATVATVNKAGSEPELAFKCISHAGHVWGCACVCLSRYCDNAALGMLSARVRENCVQAHDNKSSSAMREKHVSLFDCLDKRHHQLGQRAETQVCHTSPCLSMADHQLTAAAVSVIILTKPRTNPGRSFLFVFTPRHIRDPAYAL